MTDYISDSPSTQRSVFVGSGPETGYLETSGDSDWFRVSLTAGVTYSFSLNKAVREGLPNPYLSFYDGAGTYLTADDDSGSGLNSLIMYTPTTSGTYYLGASSSALTIPVTGEYNLLVTTPESFLTGGFGNDVFFDSPFPDRIDGGPGIDTVVMKLAYSPVPFWGEGVIINYGSVATLRYYSGANIFQNIERLEFTNITWALDIDGNGGQAYRVYQAAFNRTPDSGGLGFWINAMDSGASLKSVAEGFVGSAEFKAIYGTNPTNAQIVTKLYDNVLHRPGEPGGFNFWLGVLDSKAETLAGVLAAFSESAENQAGLVGVIGNGFAYTPFV